MSKCRSAVADAIEKVARERGAEHGANAAEWYVQDSFGGRVTRGADSSAARILQGIEDGDPEVLDTMPAPDLSGQWADETSGPTLVAESFASVGGDEDRHPRLWAWISGDCFGEICDAYEAAFSEACQDTIARAARRLVQS